MNLGGSDVDSLNVQNGDCNQQPLRVNNPIFDELFLYFRSIHTVLVGLSVCTNSSTIFVTVFLDKLNWCTTWNGFEPSNHLSTVNHFTGLTR